MAIIGMRHAVVAPFTAHTPGSEPTYGTGMIMGKAISGNLTITRNNNPLYADDAIAEDDNGVTAMQLEVGLDDILEDAQVMALGVHKVTGTGANSQDIYYEGDGSAPNVGFGYIRVRKKNGTVSYQAVWYYKAVFGIESESSETKGESINWQTPVITGRCAALSVEGTSGQQMFRKKAIFATEAAAIAWLDDLAGI